MPINTKQVFCEAVNAVGALNISGFADVFIKTESIVRQLAPKTTTAALANAKGTWYAWLLAIYAEEEISLLGGNLTMLKLPSVTSYLCTKLYAMQLQDLLEDFKAKLVAVGGANLVTSNPDFAVLRKSPLQRIYNLTDQLTESHLDLYDTQYRGLDSSCQLDELTAFIGVKTSLRPDRRIQLLHEGSLMKAIYTHLKTRNWDIFAKGLHYYGLSLELSRADIEGLCSVATHSIASASLRPERAVDAVCAVASRIQLNCFIKNYLILQTTP